MLEIKSKTLDEVKSKIKPIKECDISNKPGVYLLTCLVGRKKSYVGKSLNLLTRIRQHRYSEVPKKSDKYIQVITRAIRKYGWDNFEIRLLEVFDKSVKTNDELLDFEESYVTCFDLLNPSIGYNILPRGADCSGLKRSEESRKKMSEAKRGEKCVMFGTKHTEETKNKISNSHKGRKKSLESITKTALGHKIRINQLNKETGELIKTWDSAADAMDILFGMRDETSSIVAVCKNKKHFKSAYGFRWEYVNTNDQREKYIYD